MCLHVEPSKRCESEIVLRAPEAQQMLCLQSPGWKMEDGSRPRSRSGVYVRTVDSRVQTHGHPKVAKSLQIVRPWGFHFLRVCIPSH